jgi:hypothetical protein
MAPYIRLSILNSIFFLTLFTIVFFYCLFFFFRDRRCRVALSIWFDFINVNISTTTFQQLSRIFIVFLQHLISCKLCLYNNVNIYCIRKKEKES